VYLDTGYSCPASFACCLSVVSALSAATAAKYIHELLVAFPICMWQLIPTVDIVELWMLDDVCMSNEEIKILNM
jgi:hypothetical protein